VVQYDNLILYDKRNKMKKILVLIFIQILTIQIWAQSPTGYFHYASFMDMNTDTYLETYLAIAGNSVVYRPVEEDKIQASVEVTMVFKNGDIVKGYRKFNLKSAKLDKNEYKRPSFLHLDRFSLENGTYNFELTLKDNYADSAEIFSYSDIITINIPKDELAFSGITLAEQMTPTTKRNQYSKSGFDIVPFVSSFYPDNVNSMSFYMEIYNLDKVIGRDSSFLITTYLEGNPTKRMYTEYATRSPQKAAPINVLMKSFDITKLNSGNYNLVIELRDKENNIIGTHKKFIQRSNNDFYDHDIDYTNIDISKTFAQKITNFEQLKDHIYALYPISNQIEQKFILQDFAPKQMKLMQQFFFNFWKERNPTKPEDEWNIYKDQIRIVEKHFGYGRRRGYSTDLGRIYLKYGPPNSIREDHLGQQQIMAGAGEATAMVDAVDYQIWHYYKVSGYTDRVFVFVKGLDRYSLGEEYVLLFTDVPGEISYDDGLDFSNVNGLIQSIDSKMLRDIQNESSRALSRFLGGRK
jgi:GWxTD domain-containing protein